MRKIMIIVLIVFFVPSVSLAQEWEELRFSDENGDGINDLFRDADGDGKNDVTGKQYRHRFKFKDSDKDGINDLFRDANGDGINDLLNSLKTEITHYVIDFNNDGVNDVTGRKFERKLSIRTFIDENGDGIDDRETWAPVKSLIEKFGGEKDAGKQVMLESMDGPAMDRFIDENGDGINDGRTFTKQLNESIDK